METGNKWFKFYGQDWLTDLKVMRLSMQDRLCFITLLCLASSSSEQGTIRDCDEQSIIELSRIPEDTFHDMNPREMAEGFLERLEKLGMITLHVINDTDGVFDVVINAFQKRQETNLTGYERVKRYRDNKKEKTAEISHKKKNVIKDNNDGVINDNARIEKNRIEKKREDKKETPKGVSKEVAIAPSLDKTTEAYLSSLNDVGYVMELFRRHFGVSPKPVMDKAGRVDLSALAAGRLVKVHGRAQLKKMLTFILAYQNTDKYCRISTTPLDFEKNYSWYKTYLAQKMAEREKNKPLSIKD